MMETWLAKKLRLLRVRQGLTLVEAAKKTGVTRVTLSELERGHREPVAPTLVKIAEGYGVPVEELLEEPVVAGKDEAPDETGPLSPEWALGINNDLFHATIREAASTQLRALGVALSAYFSGVRTRDELLERGPAPDVRRVRAFSLAGDVNEELVRRGEEPLREFALVFRRFDDALSADEVRETAKEAEKAYEGEVRRGEGAEYKRAFHRVREQHKILANLYIKEGAWDNFAVLAWEILFCETGFAHVMRNELPESEISEMWAMSHSLLNALRDGERLRDGETDAGSLREITDILEYWRNRQTG